MSRKDRCQFTQQNLWVENHPLREKPVGYTCYVRICGQIQMIRINAHIPNMGRGNMHLDRFPLDDQPMFSTYTEYAAVEFIGETLEDAQQANTCSDEEQDSEQQQEAGEGAAEPNRHHESNPMEEKQEAAPAMLLDVVIHYYEPDTAIHWLEFASKPDDETRAILKAAGWRFIGAAGQWRHAGLLTPLPKLPGYAYQEGGDVDYSAERTEHYETRAQKAEQRAAAARQTVDRISGMIPMGQPILVGHHSERRHRRDLDRIDRNMQRTVEESREAQRLHQRAAASQRHQSRKHAPGAIYRRLEEIRKQYRSYQDATSEEGQRCKALLEQEIARLEAELEAAGGLPADKIEVQKGDIILISSFTVRVARVNPKSYTCDLLTLPTHRGKYEQLKFDRSFLKKRYYTAAEWGKLTPAQQAEFLKNK
jgi:hypothetical protein